MVAESDWPRARTIAEGIDVALTERRSDPTFDDDWAADPI
jgi:hypothetical protein